MNAFLSRHAVFCLLLGFAALCGCVKQATPGPVADSGQVRARLGDFAVAASPAEAENLVVPSLQHKGAALTKTSEPVRALSPEQTQTAFPLPECQSMKVEMFTGGANCCFGYYLLTQCPDGDFAAYVEPRDGGLGTGDRKLRAYPADESAFYYYEPTGQQGEDKLSLSRAVSPRPTRYIVFDNGSWRVDKPGEFPAVYNALILRNARDKGMDPAARAITEAYYTLMAGKNADAALRALKRSLPGKYASLATQIFADIQKAVTDFNPVRNLVVDQ